jgi:hypothetical protein
VTRNAEFFWFFGGSFAEAEIPKHSEPYGVRLLGGKRQMTVYARGGARAQVGVVRRVGGDREVVAGLTVGQPASCGVLAVRGEDMRGCQRNLMRRWSKGARGDWGSWCGFA